MHPGPGPELYQQSSPTDDVYADIVLSHISGIYKNAILSHENKSIIENNLPSVSFRVNSLEIIRKITRGVEICQWSM